MRWLALERLLVKVLFVAVIGLVGAAFLPTDTFTLSIPLALIAALALVACGYGLGVLQERTPPRRCPQCDRIVPVGMLACGPCGYSFVTPVVLHSQVPANVSWPKSPVKLVLPDQAPADQAAAPAAAEAASPIPVPNALQQPLLKRGGVPAPGAPAERAT